jgi:transcriptional regulator with XRE-family HTH domain
MARKLIHESMRDSRESCGVSQSELARRIKTSQEAISDYERGVHVPTIYIALDLADALGMSLEEYLGLK